MPSVQRGFKATYRQMRRDGVRLFLCETAGGGTHGAAGSASYRFARSFLSL
jgi:hypothetical protein